MESRLGSECPSSSCVGILIHSAAPLGGEVLGEAWVRLRVGVEVGVRVRARVSGILPFMTGLPLF